MNETGRKTAPESAMIAGYYFTEAREALRQNSSSYNDDYVVTALWYLKNGLSAAVTAMDDMAGDKPNIWRWMMPSPGLRYMAVACQRLERAVADPDPMEMLIAQHEIGAGHVLLDEMIRNELRYKGITQADFDELRERLCLPGGGGGR